MLLRSVASGILLAVLPALAFAQAPAKPAPAPGAPATPAAQAPAATQTAPAGESPPAADAPSDTRATGNLGGHSYSDRPAARGPRRAKIHKPTGPIVDHPGFEQLEDGGSRLFVQLSQTVPVEERKAQGTITYVLRGAHPRVWNNTNPLVTVHFSTPVASARLVRHGSDLHFVVDLRAAATPTWKMNEGQDKTATLMIDFPKGDYGPAAEDLERASEAPATKPAKAGKIPGKQPAARPSPNQPPPEPQPAGPNP